MSLPRIFDVRNPPREVQLAVKGMQLNNAPVRVRTRVTRFGGPNLPGPQGQPGSPLGPYTELGQVYNPQSAPTGPGQSAALAAGGASTPLGASGVDWNNPTTYSTIPITGANVFTTVVGGVPAILTGNAKRNSLIIQNQCTATAPDTAPTFYIDFNHQPLVGGSLAIPPGFGFFWSASDCPPRDSIYISAGPFTNTGNTVFIGGCCIQGTYVPQS